MKVKIHCSCGWSETVTEPESGQSLGGTAGWYAARHKHKNGGIVFQWGEPSELEKDLRGGNNR